MNVNIEGLKWLPDALVELSLYTEEQGGRRTGVCNNYKPQYRVLDDYLTSTVHAFVDKEIINPGESCNAYVKFITPEYYPNCLFVGRKIYVHEASKIVGLATVIEVYSDQLKADNNSRHSHP